eukprot:88538_1
MDTKDSAKLVHQVKLLTIGDSGVGKSAVILRFAEDEFTPTFLTTIGIDYKMKDITLDDESQTKCKIQIWDTAGQERFRNITTAYYRGAEGILLVYDISDEPSFLNVRYWLRQIDKHSASAPIVILVGNKCDLNHQRKVSTQRASELAKDYRIPFFETSAKTSTNVNLVFDVLTKQIIDKQKCSLREKQNKTIKLHDTKAKFNKLKQKMKCSGCNT